MLERLKDRVARLRVLQKPDIKIASSAKVNFRGIVGNPPSRLTIGGGTMFEGKIVSDREGSVVVIGNNTFIGGSTLVCADRIEIGDDVLISWGCTIVDHDSHAILWADRADDVREYYVGKKNWDKVATSPVKVGNKAWIGFNSIVLKGVTIGERSIVAAGSIVTRDVPDDTIVGGNPARVIRRIDNGNG